MFSWTKKKLSFNRLVGDFAKKPEVFSPEYTDVKKSILFKKIVSNFSYGRKESCFDQPTETLFTKSRQFFVHCQQVIKKIASKTFFSTKYSFWTRGTQCWPSFLNFFDKIPENFCSIADNDKESYFFPAGTIFLTVFLWKCRMCFWKLHRLSQQIDKKLSRNNQRR